MGFLLTGHGGICADADMVVLAAVGNGAESAAAMPGGQRYVAAVWFGPSGTPFASMARAPAHCTGGSSKTVTPGVYQDKRGRWARAGSGAIDGAYLADGWRTVLSGKVISTSYGITGFSGTRLTVSRGSSRFSVAHVT